LIFLLLSFITCDNGGNPPVYYTELRYTIEINKNNHDIFNKNVLDKFSINFGDCMWCGICIEVCPFDALFWSETELPVTNSAEQLILDQSQLVKFLPEAKRADGSAAPQENDQPSGRRKK
jgi:formate hydrogenlyase subunit 6/NADH:ubiquinone oxidoreductase subunit I